MTRPAGNMRTDLYKVLGVSADATENEIRRAYRANALLLHPDRSNSSDSSGFRKLQEAYEVLGESGTRCEADRLSHMLVDIAISLPCLRRRQYDVLRGIFR